MAELNEQQELLRQYILRLMQASVLSWDDLLSPDILIKLTRSFSRDGKVVVAYILRTGASNIASKLGSALKQFADDLVPSRKR